ncbi:hypothetical protein Rleg4DRAFT_6997 [Rhizobium leguminosarum bv. trifolii WSM2297]|uniref:Uncharacterized protein n=1 Tax=Rhizobium leguminosarum bv. trifolii WSM2297 TaxID=754762 RepID=J0CI69_RHILT|nr:hypothetical protein [Rhizobium leguminosarum]EJC83277.1 hypothetical protein Rleg4DRAFT_5025 [Rhizobium leguminosarum bv. trifolii WSM2297]EJC85130.1 hypothetical protein Rleg4DRAFT_6997 [Rhizobium leguminosarum bv. trifolii WSM2297]
MASPWKLLARLVSPLRQQRQEHGPTDEVKPDVFAIAKPAELAGNNGVNEADPPADEKPPTHDQSEPVSTEANHSEGTASTVGGSVDIEAAKPLAAPDPAVAKVATRKHGRRGKKGETAEVVTPTSLRVATLSDDAITLDGEIKLLRDQLAKKLQLQNAQLKRMLQRFER